MRDAPLSPTQRQILDATGQPAGSPLFAAQVSVSFGEAIDTAALLRAWTALSRAFPALRTTIKLKNGDPWLAEHDSGEPELQQFDWQQDAPADPAAEWKRIVDADAERPAAFESDAPCRLTLIRLPDGHTHALWSVHTLLLDEDAISRALHLWLIAYDQLRTGAESVTLPPASERPSPKDAAAIDEGYWKAHFAGFQSSRPLVLLPLPSPSAAPGSRRTISRTFERDDRHAWVEAAKGAGAGLASLVKAAWLFLVARATTASDILILESVRDDAAIDRSETLVPQRTVLDANTTAAGLVASVHKTALPANRSATLRAIAAAAGVRELLPATAFAFRDATMNDRLHLELPRWMAADVRLTAHQPFPITLSFVACDRPEVALDYDPARLSDAAAADLLERWVHLVNQFAADPTAKLGGLSILLPGEDPSLTGPEMPTLFRSLVPQCLHEIFADIAGDLPNHPAIELGGERLTFGELNARANQLARTLRKRSVQAGERVGVLAGRTPRFATSVLGILKANCSAIVLDPLAGPPRERLCNFLREHRINTLILDATVQQPEEFSDFAKILIDEEAAAIAEEKSRGVQNESAPTAEAIGWLGGDSAPALRAFTHLELATAFQSLAALLGIEPSDRLLQFAPAGSPESIEESFTALLSGASLVLHNKGVWPTRTAFQEFLTESNITALSIPAPFWSQWTHYLAELKLAVPESLRIAAIRAGRPRASVISAWSRVCGTPRACRLVLRRPEPAQAGLGLAIELSDDIASTPLPLGAPAPSAAARLTQPAALPSPRGYPGQLAIAGIPAGTGGESSRKFFATGLDALASETGVLISRDSAEVACGALTPASRIEAIETAACAHPEIFDCVVQFRKSGAGDEPWIWFVPAEPERGEPLNFRNFLRERLPASLVPARYACLPRFSLDGGGLLDLAALPEPHADTTASGESAGASPEEENLRRTISRVLGGRGIRIDEQITDGRTKPRIAKNLHEALGAAGHDVRLADFESAFSVRSVLRAIRGRAAAPEGRWAPLKPLRATGKLPPFIFLHDLSGADEPYGALVGELTANQPCYALTARGLDDPGACHQSIPEMAAAYIQAIRVFDPAGPYFLIGRGFGGLVAFEIARQLTAAGAAIGFLAIVGTQPPPMAGATARIRSLSSGLKRSLRELPALFGGRKSENSISPGQRKSQDSPVHRANELAARHYTAERAELTAHVFAPEFDFLPFGGVHSGWNACCSDAHFYQVPCAFSEMLEDPAVSAIATVLAKLAAHEELSDEIEPAA